MRMNLPKLPQHSTVTLLRVFEDSRLILVTEAKTNSVVGKSWQSDCLKYSSVMFGQHWKYCKSVTGNNVVTQSVSNDATFVKVDHTSKSCKHSQFLHEEKGERLQRSQAELASTSSTLRFVFAFPSVYNWLTVLPPAAQDWARGMNALEEAKPSMPAWDWPYYSGGPSLRFCLPASSRGSLRQPLFAGASLVAPDKVVRLELQKNAQLARRFFHESEDKTLVPDYFSGSLLEGGWYRSSARVWPPRRKMAKLHNSSKPTIILPKSHPLNEKSKTPIALR